MPKLEGVHYVPFPFELLRPQTGKMTWLREFEDSPVEGLVLEFPVPATALPGDDPEDDYRALDREVTLTIEANVPYLPADQLAGQTFINKKLPSEKFGGSIYLGWRHHGIDVHKLTFRDDQLSGEDKAIMVDVECRVFFTHEGLGAGNNAEFEDGDWSFSAPVSIADKIHTYRQGKAPSALSRGLRKAWDILKP